jgi:hypothetical protein
VQRRWVGQGDQRIHGGPGPHGGVHRVEGLDVVRLPPERLLAIEAHGQEHEAVARHIEGTGKLHRTNAASW